MMTTDHPPVIVKQIIERFHVSWQVRPEFFDVGREKRQVGFALDIYGSIEPKGEPADSESQERRLVLAALEVVAGWIVPKETRPSISVIEPNDQAFVYSAPVSNEAELRVTVKIVHREGYDQPVDQCEVRCLKEMKQRLRELGAHELEPASQEEERP